MGNRVTTFVMLAILSAAGIAGTSTAAPIGVSVENPTLQAGLASINYLEFGGDGDLSTFGATVDSANGVSPAGLTNISFGIGFPLTDPLNGTGGFDIFDANGLFLDGDLFKMGFSENTIELQFNNLSGSAASGFGSSVLASITFNEALGANPFTSLVDGNSYTASINVSRVVTTAVPEPTTLSLLFAGILGTWIFRRQRKAVAYPAVIQV